MNNSVDKTIVDVRADTFNAAELMQMKLPEPKWAIPGIIPEGQTILAGNPKLGKSWMALNLSVAVASGGVALGNVPVEAGDVLYLALEDNRRRLKERLGAVLNESPASERLTLSISWPRLNEGGSDRIEEWIEAHPDARLIIIDTFKKVRPLHRGCNNIYGEDYEDIGVLKRIADKHRIAIVAVHHTRKSVADDPIEAVSGSFGLTGATDGILILRRVRGTPDATLLVTGRDTEEQEIALKFDTDLCHWTTLGEASKCLLSDARATVIRILEEIAKPISPKELAPLIDKTEANTRQTLSRMAKDGQIKSLNDGTYTTNSHSRNESHSREESILSEAESTSNEDTTVPEVSDSATDVTDGYDDDEFNEWVRS